MFVPDAVNKLSVTRASSMIEGPSTGPGLRETRTWATGVDGHR